jgi:hypothetical protein
MSHSSPGSRLSPAQARVFILPYNSVIGKFEGPRTPSVLALGNPQNVPSSLSSFLRAFDVFRLGRVYPRERIYSFGWAPSPRSWSPSAPPKAGKPLPRSGGEGKGEGYRPW